MRRINLLSSDKSGAIRITLSEGMLRNVANNPDLGEAKDDLPVRYQGPEMTVGFNARYLTDVLSVLDSDDVIFDLGDDQSSGVLRPPDDPRFTAVVMPMRV